MKISNHCLWSDQDFKLVQVNNKCAAFALFAKKTQTKRTLLQGDWNHTGKKIFDKFYIY